MPKEELVNLALRRSVFFPTAEIYPAAPGGFYDYGPIGVKMRNAIVSYWRAALVEANDFVEVSGAQVLPKEVFKASGHLENFNDPLIQCKKCHSLHRADQLVSDKLKQVVAETIPLNELEALIEKHKIPCPKCGTKEFLPVKQFNMMVSAPIGVEANANDPGTFLRPEACQNIFLDFDRLYKTSRKKLPLGIAQAGQAFRNEIAPRNAFLRAREFGQMDIEVFFDPAKVNEGVNWEEAKNYKLNIAPPEKESKLVSCDEALKKKMASGKLILYYMAKLQQWFEALNIPVQDMRFREQGDGKPFYAKDAWDFEVRTEDGWKELVGVHYRTDYDLKGHSKESKKELGVKEEGMKESIVPHVFELSMGIDRTLQVLLELAYRKEKRGAEERIYLKLAPQLAPFQCAVFPLVNKDGLWEQSQSVLQLLKHSGLSAVFDDSGSIGRRYARVDEVGVPYAITIDYDTMKDSTVTIRDRDSLAQKRAKILQLPETIRSLYSGKQSFSQL